MNSIWNNEKNFSSFKELNGDISTDVLIIGGGMAGLLCAYMLEKNGVDYVLAEANSICSGTTKNTTAKITSQHSLIYNKIATEFDLETARLYYKSNEKALFEFRRLCTEFECDFENKPAYVYSVNNRSELESEFEILKKIGSNAEFFDNISIPLSTSGAIKFIDQGQFNPLKFASEISKKLNIFEHTKIRELIGNTAVTDSGRIKADNIIVATHFPFINKHGAYFLKMYQHRSYVLALKNADRINGMYIDGDGGLSLRNYKDYLLLGGGSHRTGKKGGGWNAIEKEAKKLYPSSEIAFKWAAQDCMTLDGIPYIGKYSEKTNNLFVATGFNKWGMTGSMAAALLLKDMITGNRNDYEQLYSPSRTILRPQLAVNIAEAAINLLSFSTKRCPHLGCALKWNKAEHSWDCPCHGSRFTDKGDIIDNPATSGIKSI